MELLEIGGIEVTLLRKQIKNLNIYIKPPMGEVIATAPIQMPLTRIKSILAKRAAWIMKNQAIIRSRPYHQMPEMITGDKLPLWGEDYSLRIKHLPFRPHIQKSGKELIMTVPLETPLVHRRALLKEWYRMQIKSVLPQIIHNAEQTVGVASQEWGVKQMKTRWGTCNIQAKRIWLNLELTRKPIKCLELVVIHELVHLHERNHTRRFFQLMDRFMPDWKTYDTILNREPIYPIF